MSVIFHIVIAEQETHLQPGESPLRDYVLMCVTAKQATLLLKGQNRLSKVEHYQSIILLHQGIVFSP